MKKKSGMKMRTSQSPKVPGAKGCYAGPADGYSKGARGQAKTHGKPRSRLGSGVKGMG